MGYIQSLADSDVYMKLRSRPDGSSYYEYVLCYVDDILCISQEPSTFMESIKKIFILKNGYSQPKTFLGSDIHRFEVHENGLNHQCWGLGSREYVQRVVAEVEKRAQEYGLTLPARAVAPMRSNYSPELDLTAELNEEGISLYQGMIGTLRWLVEIGRVDLLIVFRLCHHLWPHLGSDIFMRFYIYLHFLGLSQMKH